MAQTERGDRGRSTPETRLLFSHENRSSGLLQAVRTFGEMLSGFRTLHFVGPCVTVFGSARFAEDHPAYRMGMDVGGALAREGFTVMTGGGPGIMEAATRGAKEAGGETVGCGIHLPHEQRFSAYLDTYKEFRYFFTRKVMLMKYSYGFIALPGGFGTLDELFETATLVQTRKMPDYPIVLMGTEYWAPLIGFLRERLLAGGTIDAEDVDTLLLTDDPAEAAASVRNAAVSRFGLTYTQRPRRRWWLLE
ncbi:MAG: TIGR00730 family Rossman fold protein [Chloroflexota bacterium]